MEVIPTVRVLHPDHAQGILINESDLDDEMVLQDPKAEAARRKGAAKKASAIAAEKAADAVASNEAALAAVKAQTGLEIPQ
jgi:Pyruvate/2-oxoacid:ferredoxin oxidoreductase gamma subunit